jgi:hypothetical protein
LIPLGDGRGFKWRAIPSGSPLGAFDNTITTITAIAKKKAIEETAKKK